MIMAFDGSSIDGSAYLDVVRLARHAPGWLDGAVSFWSAYGLAVFAVLAGVGWWFARRDGGAAAVAALAVPVVVVAAFGVDAAVKLAVREDRPCRSLRVRTLEACPAPGDWSFPSNHAAIAASAAVALFFVSRRLGAVAAVAALAMAVSRVWVGAHYPHDAVAGVLVGGLVALLSMTAVRRWSRPVGRWIGSGRLRPLVTAP
ncbi:phosphatase PAP2 family protein [Streptomyces acidiscabies]|uniref:Phosphatase PAP2 family protein n=2 Tax=Streptomyces acidiscabies TaxID=42234 RepID=A0AAP6BIA4_9ACTN|nr:phosphatase PAP2 family protein [Streptomyces acidiscabies]MBP5942257.1 phosphatase PAP2 family protein [Streptomyces sp. LBUM 1476]MBZ3913789.1 phosphatase PAP2 family protein [Streptomyces acidiscabies]MDX2965264.1 phosphatase PAP2 family protein [Streptomyces acidiscabies]MDX3022120.1 phosphatase PAP2 family protein [Streptomyces acidiscabies]MDX3795383.1 phosphatase PAP2 family protein [Streptomyces acidiscabies]